MSNKYIVIGVGVAILVLLGIGKLFLLKNAVPILPLPTVTLPPATEPNDISQHADLIRVASPKSNAIILSPLTIEGEARGSWFFEASFPVRLLDANSNEIAVQPAQAQEEWMTENFVPFTAILQFEAPATNTGTLVFEKDNPSGMSANADELRVPVRFR